MSRGHWIVRGVVQGVGFRMYAREEAERLGLRCRVWNRDDGAFECTAEGHAAALDLFERWLHRGPPAARVASVEKVGV